MIWDLISAISSWCGQPGRPMHSAVTSFILHLRNFFDSAKDSNRGVWPANTQRLHLFFFVLDYSFLRFGSFCRWVLTMPLSDPSQSWDFFGWWSWADWFENIGAWRFCGTSSRLQVAKTLKNQRTTHCHACTFTDTYILLYDII
jgi:hypothetical protein